MVTKDAPTTAAPLSGVGTRRKPRRSLAPWLLLTPAGVAVLLVTVIPIGFLVFASFTDYDQRSLFTGEFSMVGLAQYVEIFTSAEFWKSVLRTVWFTAAMVLGTIVIGTGVAQLMTRISTGVRYVVTVILILAWAMPNVASSMVWNWLFQPGYGVVNWLLTQVQIFGDMTNTAWANNTALAYTAIWMLVVWQAVPFVALTLYAALTQIPKDPIEAAWVDGATGWQVWWKVIMPFLRPTFLLVTIMSIIWDANVFNQIWLVSAGGPGNSTSTLGVYAFKKAFVGFEVGTGSAIAVITLLLLVAVTSIYIRNLLRSGEDL